MARWLAGCPPARQSPRLGSEMDLKQTRRVIAAGVIGNVLEWYDFSIYAYVASAIGRQFFPDEDAVPAIVGGSTAAAR